MKRNHLVLFLCLVVLLTGCIRKGSAVTPKTGEVKVYEDLTRGWETNCTLKLGETATVTRLSYIDSGVESRNVLIITTENGCWGTVYQDDVEEVK